MVTPENAFEPTDETSRLAGTRSLATIHECTLTR